MKVKKLSLNHKKFVKHYIATGNASAAIRKVYPNDHHSDSTGSKMLSRPNIQEAIQEAFAKLDRGVDQEIGQLVNLADTEVLKELPTASEKIRANEILLKLRGAFNQPNMNLNFSITGKIEDMPEGQARELLEKIRQKNTVISSNP